MDPNADTYTLNEERKEEERREEEGKRRGDRLGKDDWDGIEEEGRIGKRRKEDRRV